MLFLGHIGITAGAAKAFEILVPIIRPDNSDETDANMKFSTTIGRERLQPYYLLNRVKELIGPIDYRAVLVGSLLPDIIDKPMWLFTTIDIPISGRGYAHTLLFNLILLISGLVLIKYRKPWLLVISLSSFMHLILDQMWNNPVTLLWPLLGPLTEKETTDWLSNILLGLFSHPGVYIPEIIGLLIVSLFAYRLMKRKKIISFLRDGAVG